MGGTINIASTLAVATKARLDSIAVKGDCECGDAPPPAEPSVDIIVCVDGSDSYNSKAELKVGTVEGGTFAGTVEALQQYLFPAIAEKLGGKNNVGLIQFSGIKQLEGAYVPGNDGEVNGMQHWQWEIEPTELTNKNCYFKQLNEADTLDGNGQLFLCLQDLTLKNVMNKNNLFKSSNKKVVIAISDEEWDLKKLVDADTGKRTDRDTVCDRVHNAGYTPYAIIVRQTEEKIQESEDFIVEKFCRNKKRYQSVRTGSFEKEMEAALKAIVADICK